MNPPKSLQNRVTWHTALQIAGISHYNKALPFKVACPFCPSDLTIYDDVSTTVQWFYCSSCKAAGDMIELIAARLKISLDKAIAMLEAHGVLDSKAENHDNKVSNYVTRTVGIKNNLAAFWAQCQKNSLSMTADHRVIAARLNFKMGKSWDTIGSTLIGFCNKKVAEKALVATSSEARSGARRLFIGEGWGEVCVIPSFDMPGRIKSLTFIGRLDEPELTITVRHALYNRAWGHYDRECGLTLLEEALISSHRYIVVADNLIHSMRMVLEYADSTGEMPPIVIAPEYAVRRSASCGLLKDAGKIITMAGPKVAGLLTTGSYLRVSKDPGEWSSPWMGPIKWVKKVIEGSKEQSRTLETSPINKSVKSIIFAGKKYEQRADGLYCENEIMCDALFIIKKVKMVSARITYTGTIKLGNKTIEFEDRASTVDNGFARWIKAECVMNGLQSPLCSKRFSRIAPRIFTLLNPPTNEVMRKPQWVKH